MTHDEKWIERYEEAMLFYKENDRKPFRYIPEERNLRSCWKTTNKRITTGGLKPDRVEKFNQQLVVIEENKHVNKYKY